MIEDQKGFYTDDFMVEVMGIEELPATLCHYTSAKTLEKILQTRSLRFSRLDKVNDPEEATAPDVPLAASSVFVSCWSADEREHIPMWSMYGDKFEGVRITLPANMFMGRMRSTVLEKGGAHCRFVGEYHISREAPAMSTSGCAIIGPNKIWYSDDPVYRNRRLIYRDGDTARFSPHDLGMVKGTHWAYEQEWRFKIGMLSFEAHFPNDRYFNEVTLNLAAYPVQTEALFIPLDPSALDELEVTLGALAGTAVFAQVEHLLAAHAPKARLARSQISIR